MRQHFYNVCEFRSERSAVLDFRKRVSWYAKQMNPCRMLKQEMIKLETPAQFEDIVGRFLEWRLRHDEDVRTGRAARVEEAEEVVEAA